MYPHRNRCCWEDHMPYISRILLHRPIGPAVNTIFRALFRGVILRRARIEQGSDSTAGKIGHIRIVPAGSQLGRTWGVDRQGSNRYKSSRFFRETSLQRHQILAYMYPTKRPPVIQRAYHEGLNAVGLPLEILVTMSGENRHHIMAVQQMKQIILVVNHAYIGGITTDPMMHENKDRSLGTNMFQIAGKPV